MDEAKVMATKKRMLSKALGRAKLQIDGSQIDDLKISLVKLAELFEEFEIAQEGYADTLEELKEIEQAEKYYDDVISKYSQTRRDIIKFLADPEDRKEEAASIKKQQDITSSLVQALNLPRIELLKFDGNPRRYMTFITIFKETVESVTKDGQTRLSQLLYHTTGEAHRTVESYILEGGESGYLKAMEMLESRFGSSHVICEAMLSDLRAMPNAYTALDLRDMSDRLRHASVVLMAHNRYSEIDTQTFILSLCLKLKLQLRYHWRERATDGLRRSGSYPSFNDFSKFVETQAEIQNDPIYGGDSLGERRNTQVTKSSSFAGTSRGVTCFMCGGDYRLFLCKLFLSQSVIGRSKFVTDNNLCTVCFSKNHVMDECTSTYRCTVNNCNGRHSRSIHVDGSYSNCSASSNCFHHTSVLMPILPITVNGTFHTYALLDTGSSDSFCSRRLANTLSISGPIMSYCLNTLNSTLQKSSELVEFTVLSTCNSNSLSMKNVRVIDNIPVHNSSCDLTKYRHLEDLCCPGNVSVDVLIGQDYPSVLIPLDVRSGTDNEPFAVLSSLGWTLNGPVASRPTNKRVVSHFISTDVIENKLERLWEIDRFDVDNNPGFSREDVRVLELWNQRCRVIDGHYEIPIPWRDTTRKLPNNQYLAQSRLTSLLKSLNRRNLFNNYDSEIEKMLLNGYAEHVPPSNDVSLRQFYLPHQAVTKKPGKLRVVFDCASKCDGISLNGSCLQGPNLTCKLFDVLIRFRQFPYALTADITAMYNQVRIPTYDRDALRFLWVKDNKVIQYRMTCHLFGGVWCSSSSSFALKNTAEITTDGDVKSIITSSFYVDDLLWSTRSLADAKRLMPEVKLVLAKRGFNLTKYIASHQDMLTGIPQDDKLRHNDQMLLCHSDKALGVGWCLGDDTLYVNHNLRTVSTKTDMLSSLASVYDPLGLITPLHIPGKLLFQQATKLKLSWQDSLPEKLIRQWDQWIESMHGIRDFVTRRCIIPIQFQDAFCELHCFSDASEQAYGCCIYLRCINKLGAIYTSLVCSKSRVCPKRVVTIPRLELQAAVLSAQLESSVRAALTIKMPPSYFWSDSTIALAYIKNESRRFHTFVTNRITTILSMSKPGQWRHLPGSQNPADLVSRGALIASFDTRFWQDGPTFLRDHKHTWHKDPDMISVGDDDPEVKNAPKVAMCIGLDTHPIAKLFDHFSTWRKIRNIVAWLIRIKSFLKTRIGGYDTYISVLEGKRAEVVIFKYVQGISFGEDINRLGSNLKISNNSQLRKLDVRLNENEVLVVGGRLAHSQLKYDQKHPVVLPHDHILSTLIIRDIHQRCHLGREWILSIVRKHFWITKARSLVYRVSNDCITCKRLFSLTSTQKMADLPESRIKFDKVAFENTAVDCFGPFYVKHGRYERKRYGCVFTCLNIRAIHVEKLDDLECDTFINAMRRFISRRGKPSKMYSDNGTNLTSAHAEIRRALNQLHKSSIEKYCANHEIEWYFHPPTASHMNGACERMIRTIRKVMTGMLADRCRLTDDILNTLFTEVESIVNHRPLTKVSDDITDDVPLTPAHMLMVRSTPPGTPGVFTQGDMYRRRWRYTQYLADLFWKRYLDEYLPELQKRQKWTSQKCNIKVGDLVLILHENTPRRLWPLGLVVECRNGRDGLVRSVRLKTQSRELVRPISKLVLLEV